MQVKLHWQALAVLLAVLVVLILGFFALQNIRQPAGQEKVKIGVMAPFSGHTAWWGEYVKQGVELAFEDLPEKEKQNIELVWEDDQCEAQEAVNAAQKLVFAQNVKYVIGPLCNEATIPTEEIFETNKIISLSTGLPNNQIASMGKYHFSFLPEIKDLMKELANYAYFKAQDRGVGVVYIQGSYGFENYFYFKKYFQEFGGKMVAEESFDISSSDIRTQLEKIKVKEPDALLIVAYGPSVINVLQELEEIGLSKTRKYGINSFESAQVLQEAASLAEGVIYPKAEDKNQTEQMLSYAKKYRQRFGKESDVYSANAYDSLKILAVAIKECKNNSSCAVQEISELKDYAGANGNFSIDERGVARFNQVLLKTVKNGKFVRLED